MQSFALEVRVHGEESWSKAVYVAGVLVDKYTGDLEDLPVIVHNVMKLDRLYAYHDAHGGDETYASMLMTEIARALAEHGNVSHGVLVVGSALVGPYIGRSTVEHDFIVNERGGHVYWSDGVVFHEFPLHIVVEERRRELEKKQRSTTTTTTTTTTTPPSRPPSPFSYHTLWVRKGV